MCCSSGGIRVRISRKIKMKAKQPQTTEGGREKRFPVDNFHHVHITSPLRISSSVALQCVSHTLLIRFKNKNRSTRKVRFFRSAASESKQRSFGSTISSRRPELNAAPRPVALCRKGLKLPSLLTWRPVTLFPHRFTLTSTSVNAVWMQQIGRRHSGKYWKSPPGAERIKMCGTHMGSSDVNNHI